MRWTWHPKSLFIAAVGFALVIPRMVVEIMGAGWPLEQHFVFIGLGLLFAAAMGIIPAIMVSLVYSFLQSRKSRQSAL